MKQFKYIAIIMLSACSVTLHHTGSVDVHVTIGPDFQGASAFCDTKYGAGTAASDSCFQAYMDYTKATVSVSLDLSSITAFCQEAYTDPVAQGTCVTDLADSLEQILANQTGTPSGS